MATCHWQVTVKDPNLPHKSYSLSCMLSAAHKIQHSRCCSNSTRVFDQNKISPQVFRNTYQLIMSNWGTDDSKGWGTKDSQGWGAEDSKGRGTKDSQGWGTKDSQGWGAEDSKGRGNKDSQSWGDADSKGRGTKESQGWGTKDSQGWGDADSKGRGTKESHGWGTKDSQGWGAEDSKGRGNKDSQGWGAGPKCGDDAWGSSTNCEEQPKKRFKHDEQTDEERPAPYKPDDLNLDEEAQLQGDGAGENFKKYDEQKVVCLPLGSVTPIEKFEDVITSEVLLTSIKAQKYASMTPIQKWSIPAILSKQDLIGCAQTGSGKTAAFLLPVLQDLLKSELEPTDPNSDCQNPYCLIISPTRELARQISVQAGFLSRDSIIKCCCIYGQVQTSHLKSQLSRGCHILVATPGRLKDFVERGWIGFKDIRYVILDEGDRLVDEGFSSDIKNFFEHPTMPPKSERQTLFFSATFKDDTQVSAKAYLKDDFIFLTVGRIGAANEDIKQEFLQVSRQEKKRELKKILMEVPETAKTIIFTQTKMAADMLAGFFSALKLSSTSIHGDRHQSQREEAIRAFKRGDKRFLISSPVGNRGLDLPKVSLVINYDLPNNIDEYVHRIGRTGRAGHTGRAISFYDAERDREILPQLIDILKEVKQEIPDWMLGGGGDASASAGGADCWDTAAPATSETNNWDSLPSKNDNNASQANDDWGNPVKPNQPASNFADSW